MRQKRNLDEVDLTILRLLVEDGRPPYSEVAEHVGLSPPAVSDRVDRLREQGAIRRFTVNIDRSKLQHRNPLLVEFQPVPANTDAVSEAVRSLDGIEEVFEAWEGRIIAYGHAPEDDITGWLHSSVPMEHLSNIEVSLVGRRNSLVNLHATAFALSCDVCGNTVGSDGISMEIGGETEAFCCPSCKNEYENQHERHRSNAV